MYFIRTSCLAPKLQGFLVNRRGKLILGLGPIIGAVLLWAYMWVPGRPFIWAKASEEELVVVLEGPITPFGRMMEIGALLPTNSLDGIKSARILGSYFVDKRTDLSGGGFDFGSDGVLYLRLRRNRIWMVKPRDGEARLLQEIGVQDTFSRGDFSSLEFCAYNGTVWFETFDQNVSQGLFAQHDQETRRVTSQKKSFEILGCTDKEAVITWSEWPETGKVYLSKVQMGSRDRLDILTCAKRDCIIGGGCWANDSTLYLGRVEGEYWFYLLGESGSTRLTVADDWYRGWIVGNAVFLARANSGWETTIIKRIDIESGKSTNEFEVRGKVKGLGCAPVLRKNSIQDLERDTVYLLATLECSGILDKSTHTAIANGKSYVTITETEGLWCGRVVSPLLQDGGEPG